MRSFAGFGRGALGLALAGCIIGNGDRPSTTDLKRAPLIHRPTAPACTSTGAGSEPDLGGVTNAACTQNEDCTSGPNGRCVVSDGSSSCQYDACAKDLDCNGVAVCECGGPINVCVANGCHDDHQCGEGGYCSPTQGECGTKNLFAGMATTNGYPHHCHTDSDLCIDDADCAGSGYCRYDASSLRWRCSNETCP